MATHVVATVTAFMGGALNWAVITTGDPPADVHTMTGTNADKSARVTADAGGRLGFEFVVNAFPGTAWRFTLTEDGADTPKYERAGLTDHQGRGHDGGIVTFAAAHA